MKKIKKIMILSMLALVVVSQVPIDGSNVTQTVLPDGIVSMTNMQGNVSAIQDDVDAIDGNWITPINPYENADVSGTFASPPSNLVSGAGLQKFRAFVKKSEVGGNVPAVIFYIYERRNGTLTQLSSVNGAATDAGVMLEVNIDAANIVDKTGSSIEFKVLGAYGSGGPSTKRTIQVAAVNWDATIEQLIPFSPTNFSFENRTTTGMKLTWNEMGKATSYELKRNGQVIYTGSNTSYVDTGLSPSTSYAYSVVAMNSYGTSPASTLNATTTSSSPPSSVTNIQTPLNTWNSVILQWDGDWNASSYEVSRNGVVVFTSEGKMKNKFRDRKLNPSTTYTYSIVAKNESGSSQPASITVKTKRKSILTAGSGYVAYLDEESRLWTWGNNLSGQLGDGTGVDSSYPKRITSLSNIQDINAGTINVIAVGGDGSFWTWGKNTSGQLGIGNTTNQLSPVTVKGVGGTGSLMNGKKGVGAYAHNIFLANDGTVYASGNNVKGQLGNGTTTNSSVPVQVKGPGGVGVLSDIVDIDAGYEFNLAIRSDGTVWAWGDNSSDQMGNGVSGGVYTSPVQVIDSATSLPLTDIVEVYGGRLTSYALKSDGTVYVWGANGTGQYGNGNKTERFNKATALHYNMDMLSGGGLHAFYAVNNKLMGFGANNYGQLALGTNIPDTILSPSQTVGINNVGFLGDLEMIVAGDLETYAKKSDGTVLAWGEGGYGQMGDGQKISRHYPVVVLIVPYRVANLRSTEVTATSLKLQWDAAQGASSYEVVRDGTVVYTGSNPEFSDTGLVTGKNYMYSVYAINARGKGSAASIFVTPTSDTTPPGEVTELTETHGETNVRLSWKLPLDGDFQFVKLYRNETLIASNVTGTGYDDGGLTEDTAYTYKLTTVDKTGNESAGVSLVVKTNKTTPVPTGSIGVVAPTSNVSFGTVVIDGKVQRLTSGLSELQVKDDRSVSEGWHVSVSASRFVQTNPAEGQEVKQLPVNSLSLKGVKQIIQIEGNSVLPSSLVGGYTAIDNGEVSFLSAGVNEGIGKFVVSFDEEVLQLNLDTSKKLVDSTTTEALYESVITWTISTGP